MHFKKLLQIIVFTFALNGLAQLPSGNLPRNSQKSELIQTVGITKITVKYARPLVKGREIWGGLVPFGMTNQFFGSAPLSPWRAGADENTIFKVTDDIYVEGKKLKAGVYGLHMIIEQNDDVEIIFSHTSTDWGSFNYNSEEDALRVKVKSVANQHTEVLTYQFVDLTRKSTTLALLWDKKRIPISIEVPVDELVKKDLRRQMRNAAGFNRSFWEQGANYYLRHNVDLEEGLRMIDSARTGRFYGEETFMNARIKAGILNAQGKKSESLKLMEASMSLGSIIEIHNYGRQLLRMGEKEKAIDFFKYNYQKHPDDWTTNFGMARAYSAQLKFQKAIKHLNKALESAPTEFDRNDIKNQIEKLKNNEDIN